MSLKRTIIHPSFISGLVSYMLLPVGVVLNASSFESGKTLIIASLCWAVFIGWGALLLYEPTLT